MCIHKYNNCIPYVDFGSTYCDAELVTGEFSVVLSASWKVYKVTKTGRYIIHSVTFEKRSNGDYVMNMLYFLNGNRNIMTCDIPKEDINKFIYNTNRVLGVYPKYTFEMNAVLHS